MGAFCLNCLSSFCEVEKLQLDLSPWFAARHNVGLVMLHFTRNRSGRFLTGRLRQHRSSDRRITEKSFDFGGKDEISLRCPRRAHLTLQMTVAVILNPPRHGS